MKTERKYNSSEVAEKNMTKVNNAKRIIEIYGLKRISRNRNLVYQRCYIMAKLRQMGCSYPYISELFNKDHASVIHSVKTHNHFTKMSDMPYRIAIEPVKTAYHLMNQQANINIYDDVLSAEDFNDVLLIKEKIHSGLYN